MTRPGFALSEDAASADIVIVGHVKRAHGIRGGVLVVPLSDHPDRFRPGATFTVVDGPATIASLTVTSVVPHNEGLVLRSKESPDREHAELLAKAGVAIRRSELRDLGPGEFWPHDLVGLEARDPDGGIIGTVTDVILGESQDRLVVTTTEGIAVEVPFVSAIVGEPSSGSVTIDAPDGLFP